MTHLLLSELDAKRIFYSGLVLLYLYAVLPVQSSSPGVSVSCTTFNYAGGSIDLLEGQNTSLMLYLMTRACDRDACVAAKTNCTSACQDCFFFDIDPPTVVQLAGVGVNPGPIPGLVCHISPDNNGSEGFYPITCFTGNNLAGQSGYSLVLSVGILEVPLATKSATIRFVAGDVVVANCLGMFEGGTDKVYAGSDNMFQIWLKDAYNNTVGAGTYRLGITPIPFTITVTYNPDDGTQVSLGQTPTVDTTGDNGFYVARINPTKPGNYLAKIGTSDAMIHNSPFAFQALKGRKNSASLMRPSFRGFGAWCFFFSVVYMDVVFLATGNLI